MSGQAHFEVFPDAPDPRNSSWFWRLKSANGEIVARSSEGYRDPTDAERAAADLVDTALAARRLPTGEPGSEIDIRRVDRDADFEGTSNPAGPGEPEPA